MFKAKVKRREHRLDLHQTFSESLTLTQKNQHDNQSYWRHHPDAVFSVSAWKQFRLSVTEELKLWGAVMQKIMQNRLKKANTHLFMWNRESRGEVEWQVIILTKFISNCKTVKSNNMLWHIMWKCDIDSGTIIWLHRLLSLFLQRVRLYLLFFNCLQCDGLWFFNSLISWADPQKIFFIVKLHLMFLPWAVNIVSVAFERYGMAITVPGSHHTHRFDQRNWVWACEKLQLVIEKHMKTWMKGFLLVFSWASDHSKSRIMTM